ncbi:MAG: NAD(P)-dependent alcohol dehydrogenase [Pyrinomonadaceae bacterium]|nr:NAD(P)-dependent alcohol dehydrogenase [Pyrinomonadaceae bacterium]
MNAIEIQQFGIENLTLVERDEPQPQANEVLIKFHAVSLNYRDLLVVKGLYNPKMKLPRVPFSDGAGEIVAVGESVTKWKVGDRVTPAFMPDWTGGEYKPEYQKIALGGDVDGCLREFGAFHENGVVRIPEHLSYEKAATLPCAAVTAWNALVNSGNLKAGDTVLTQGTGGVSVFAIQFAKAFGAEVYATSSSDEKLAKAKELGASKLINYKTTPDWDKEIFTLSDKKGVDHIVEVGGGGTLGKSLKAVRAGGHVAVIGILTNGEINPMQILMKAVRLHGIYVGSVEMFEAMNRAITQNQIKPAIDRVFDFNETHDALKYMESAGHFGKIVIKF